MRPQRPLTAPPRAVVLAAVLAAAPWSLAGCGGSSGRASSSAGTGSTQASQASDGAQGSSGSQGSQGSGFAGAALPAGVRAPRFVLRDQSGRPAVLGGPADQVTVVAFLRTDCRACSLVAQQVRGALDRLARPLPTLFVSVDPATDSPKRVQHFLRSVGLAGRVRFLIGPAPALAQVWRAYHVTTPSAGREAFERAATVLLIDRAGFQRVLYQQEQLTPESLLRDIQRIQTGPPGRREAG